ncbi:uncharacterized protein LOC128548538 [Mercenaria mercenaria]|uniref:uncharacterized protein LOC128548538 n=1 Tax=Mercenaria mercenaria TaxID=6596 RepID=UPI00234F08EC|nr:uncharacterized protein LOC128548538 [Mercenaria mercenaria]
MTYSDSFTCDDNTIQTGETIDGEGTIDCFDNCVGTLGYLHYQCTDYSTNEDWSSGKGRITATLTSSYPSYSYNYGSSVFHFGFKGQAWINTLVIGSGGSWQLKTTADLTYRSDIGRINSSPRAEVSPIVRLQRGCNHTVIIPGKHKHFEFKVL